MGSTGIYESVRIEKRIKITTDLEAIWHAVGLSCPTVGKENWKTFLREELQEYDTEVH